MSRERGSELGDFTANRRLLLLIPMAGVVGTIAAFVAAGLVHLIDLVTNLAYYHRLSLAPASPADHHLGAAAVLVPVIGGLIIGLMARYGSERILIDSSADWGVSDPLAVPKTAKLMLERGIARADVEAICYGNALAAYGQSGQMKEEHWLNPAPIDQRVLFEGNSVLRGQQPKVGEAPAIPDRADELVFK